MDRIKELEAECERLRGENADLRLEAGGWFSALRPAEAERDTLRAKLDAHIRTDNSKTLANAIARIKELEGQLDEIQAARGEVVEVVAHFVIPTKGSYKGRRFAANGEPPESPSQLKEYEPLMTVAQHQRIVAAMAAELEQLRGLVPELPPRPPEGDGLPRYGLRWNGPGQPIAVPMCGDWRDTTLAIHGVRSGHIASGIPEGAAHEIIKAHNAGLPDAHRQAQRGDEE